MNPPVKLWGSKTAPLTFTAGPGLARSPDVVMPSAPFPGGVEPPNITDRWLNVQVSALVDHSGAHVYTLDVVALRAPVAGVVGRDNLGRCLLGPPWGGPPTWESAAWVRLPWTAGHLAIFCELTLVAGVAVPGTWAFNWWVA